MNRLSIHLQNCYGIGNLDEVIDYSNNNTAIIYAPNGTMKTSLTNVLRDIAARKSPSDLFYPDRQTVYDVKSDDIALSPDQLYIFQNEGADGKEGVSTFLANKELKNKYDEIHRELAAAKKALSKNIKSVSSSSDIEDETLEAFRENEGENFYDCLLRIKSMLPADGTKLSLYTFKYNDIFDKNGLVKQFLDENQETFTQYFNTYATLIKDSSLFSAGVDSFGTSQANALFSSVGDNRFFLASHSIHLKDGSTIDSKDSLKDKIKNEVERIFNDDTLKGIFADIEKKLAKNAALKSFKEVIQKDPSLIVHLQDYSSFRKEVIMGYMQNYQAEFDGICDLYNDRKPQLQEIITKAKAELSKWHEIINIFNARFFVPFKVVINNVSDILLNDQTASLGFIYKDAHDSAEVQPDQKSLLDTMSTGEVRAFNILQNLFVIEGLKAEHKETLIVLDDIADSFDYKNKYAIIEYLNDIKQEPYLKLLILTHNFDFYRTIVSRLGVNNHKFAYKTNHDRTIKFGEGIHKPDIIKNRFIDKASTSDRAFIGLIPFVRNIIEYTDGDNDPDYLTLTACLHDKDSTSGIQKSTIADIFKRHIRALSTKDFPNGDILYISLLENAVQESIADINEIDLSNKLVLSIQIRLMAEKYMESVLTAEQLAEIKPNKNQTGELSKVFKKYYSESKASECLLINKVLMLTSENIHLNNFMFEPLVDMSFLHLKQLYDEIKQL